MIDNELLEILNQGVINWNNWRERNSKGKIPINFTDSHLFGANLSGVDLSNANLCHVDLSNALLLYANLESANLESAIMKNAELYKANLHYANLDFVDLSGADLSCAILNLINISDAKLVGIKLSRTKLQGVDLSYSDLAGAYLYGVDLTDTDLTYANFYDSNLSNAGSLYINFSGAIVNKAIFTNSHLGYSIFENNCLENVIGLETVKYYYPSTIGIDTIFLSDGKIPEVFLRGAGFPESFILYINSLVGKPLDFYSCFISYSNMDYPFAERLHSDLQSHSIRCWFAPEDLKIGENLRSAIDNSIRVHEKLLLILSDYYINSQWVEIEVETALARERIDKRSVLFLIRIDDSVMDID